MKNKSLLVAIIFSLGLAGVYIYLSKKKKNSEKESGESLPAPTPPPGSVTDGAIQSGIGGNLGFSQTGPITYFTDSGPGMEALDKRMKAMYRNKSVRLSILRKAGINDLFFNGMKYPEGMRQIAIALFGNLDNLPVIPEFVDGGAFIAQMEALQSLENINSIDAKQDLEAAKSAYRNAAQLPDGGTLWPANADDYVLHDQFGKAGRADRNKSNLWDRFGEDLKVQASNLVNASGQLGEVIKEKAVADLQAAGWNFADL